MSVGARKLGRPSSDQLTRSLDDNTQRLRTLMVEHQSMVFSIALRILGDRSAAEEAAQDVFIELHAKLGELASDQHVLYWLRRVTVHRSIDLVRRRQRRPQVAMDWNQLPDLPDLSSEGRQPDPLLSRRLYRFKPATLQGKPVPVEVNIEVTFRIY